MQKAIKTVSVVGFSLCFFVFILILYGTYFIPDSKTVTDTSGIRASESGLFSFDFDADSASADDTRSVKTYSAQIKLLNAIPVKPTTVTVVSRRYVTPGGNAFGLRIYSDGVIVASVGTVAAQDCTESPAKKAGLKQGDIIKKIDGTAVTSNSQITGLIEKSNGRKMSVVYVRDGKPKTTEVVPLKSAADGKYKLGLWVRDSSAGVGTVTFIDNATGTFAGLGHAICDTDTGGTVPLRYGDTLPATIRGCIKGTSGTPGELCGVFGSGTTGRLYINGSTGVFGVVEKKEQNAKTVPVALGSEVSEGKAQIISTINGDEPKYFDIEITKIYHTQGGEKNMVIKITDGELLKKTGGIVQGMSGSPIIQNGMLVGAVTHVFVNDPQQGYAIFAENMVETARQLETQLNNAAA